MNKIYQNGTEEVRPAFKFTLETTNELSGWKFDCGYSNENGQHTQHNTLPHRTKKTEKCDQMPSIVLSTFIWTNNNKKKNKIPFDSFNFASRNTHSPDSTIVAVRRCLFLCFVEFIFISTANQFLSTAVHKTHFYHFSTKSYAYMRCACILFPSI